MNEVFKKFGKYFLLDLLAQGGMAEIYRARHATPTGGGRLLAVKKIQPSYSANPEFVSMFQGETKVTGGFTHPNIVQVYDYGEEQGQLFIAMEYVDGKNLRQCMTRLQEQNTLFSVEICCYMIEQAAQALYYAHEYKDKFSGKHLNIIHRDISPQNLLVSFDGAVKVIDFGIAKTEVQSESTRTGIIKGKPAYLSPEQIAGQTLDGRSDVFALGAVFWELLTGRKLFASDNDLAVIRMIENCDQHFKPPSLYNPKVPKELDLILAKCLQKDRSKRFSSAAELQRAIHKFLYQHSMDFNPTDLAQFVRELFKKEILEDRKKLQTLNDKAEQLIQLNQEVPPLPSTAPQPPQTAESATQFFNPPAAPATTHSITAPTPQTTSPPRFEASKIIEMNREDEKSASHLKIERTGTHQKVIVPQAGHTYTRSTSIQSSRNNSNSNSNSFSKILIFGAVLLFCGILGYQKIYRIYIDQTNTNRMPQSNQQDASLNSTNTSSASVHPPVTTPETTPPQQSISQPLTVTLKLKIFPRGTDLIVKVNDQVIQGSGDGSLYPIPLDRPVRLSLEKNGYEKYEKDLFYSSRDYASNASIDLSLELLPLASQRGYITIITLPSSQVTFRLPGSSEEQVLTTPISQLPVPVGTYQFKLTNDLLQMSKTVDAQVDLERVTRIDEKLTP